MPRKRPVMRGFCLALTVLVFACSPASAMFSLDDTVSQTASPFSGAFTKAYEDAKFGSGPPDEASRFENLLNRFKRPEEQAELQLTLGIIYNQRTGLVDHRKAVVHMSEALKHDLNQVVRVKTYLLRGNSFETLNQQREALEDYVRGLRICVECDLPDKSPPHPVIEKLPNIGAQNSPENEELIKQHNRTMAKHRFQTLMIRQRYYYVDAIKRIRTDGKISDDQFKSIVVAIVKDKKVVGWILKRANSPNEKPWN